MVDLEEIFGGYSGARLFRIRTETQDYCVKILPERLSEGSAARVKEICKIYQKARIHSLSLRGYGNLEAENRHFYIYDFIEGESFKEYSNRELSAEEIRKIGREIGQKLRNLKLDKNLAGSTQLATDNISRLTEYGIERYHELLNNATMMRLMREFFEITQIEKLMQEFVETKDIFLGLEPKLIHGDLKRSNMVYGKDGKIYLIDIESMRKSYDVLNLRYQMTWIMFPEAKKERAFVSGVFDGLYKDGRPEKFNEQLRYVLMLNFLEHTTKALKRDEDVWEYFTKMQVVFQEVQNNEQTIL